MNAPVLVHLIDSKLLTPLGEIISVEKLPRDELRKRITNFKILRLKNLEQELSS